MNKQTFVTILVVTAASLTLAAQGIGQTLGLPAVSGSVTQLAAGQSTRSRAEEAKAQTVYVARTGKRYHRSGCRYLAQGKTPLTLKEAKAKGYTPCKVCHPPS